MVRCGAVRCNLAQLVQGGGTGTSKIIYFEIIAGRGGGTECLQVQTPQALVKVLCIPLHTWLCSASFRSFVPQGHPILSLSHGPSAP